MSNNNIYTRPQSELRMSTSTTGKRPHDLTGSWENFETKERKMKKCLLSLSIILALGSAPATEASDNPLGDQEAVKKPQKPAANFFNGIPLKKDEADITVSGYSGDGAVYMYGNVAVLGECSIPGIMKDTKVAIPYDRWASWVQEGMKRPDVGTGLFRVRLRPAKLDGRYLALAVLLKEMDADTKPDEAILKAQAEALLKAQLEEAAQVKAREEAARAKAREEAAQVKAREEAAQLKARKEAAQLKAREEAARVKAFEEAARKKAREDRLQKAEEARHRAEQEAHRKAREEAKLKEEREAASKKKAESEAEARINAILENYRRIEQERLKARQEEARRKAQEEAKLKDQQAALKNTALLEKIKGDLAKLRRLHVTKEELGRLPGDFNPAVYAKLYPDIGACAKRPEFNIDEQSFAVLQYIRWGFSESWRCKGFKDPATAPADFDSEQYLKNHPELEQQAKHFRIEPLLFAKVQYVNWGIGEGKSYK